MNTLDEEMLMKKALGINNFDTTKVNNIPNKIFKNLCKLIFK